jgi:mannose-1-phosphate guanylyltransferase
MLDHDEVVLVSPSDHLINNHIEYLKVLGKAEKEAKKGSLVTFGIVPDFAETGFGYIEISDNFEKNRVFDVQAFHEKPTVEIATEYLEKRSYYWNSGMYCFKVGVFLGELKKYSPKIYEASVSALKGLSDSNMIRIKDQDMSNIPEDSIDCAVMEKSSKVKVIHSDIGWSDVGIFETLFDALPKDKNGNNLNEKHIALDSYNNLVYGSDRYIATIDIENCIIVDTGDALLVSKQGSSQKVKKIVKELGKSTDLHNIHLTAHRPWGTFTILEDSNKYKIKRIVVNPGNRLSLQKHYHRNEHWVVVSGTATVTVGDETRFVRPNESTYIKMGELHRLSNEGKIPVVMIEVQVGEYMKEDDIVRVDDDFNR